MAAGRHSRETRAAAAAVVRAMTSREEPPDREAGSVRARGAALAFRALAVIVLVNAHWLHLWGMPLVRPTGYFVILGCCLLVFALAGARSWKAPGTPGAWIAAAVASWLVVGGAVSLSDADGAHPEAPRTALRQVFFLVVLLAAAVGGRVVLRRVGTERFLKGVLAILIASCVAVPLTPVLRDLGVLPVYRLPHRLPGVFTHHADAGFLGCMTAVLALALLCADGRRRLAYAGLAAGYGAVLASTSRTAAVSFAVVFAFFLTSKGLGARRPLLRWLLAPALAGLAIYQAGHPLRTWLNHPFHGEASCSTAARDNPGLLRDCAALLAARDVLAGGAALNWKESTPLASWKGVTLIEAPARVGALDLSGLDLRGRIPPELGGLSALHVLRLTGNRLTGPVPPELGNLVHLRVLALDANALTGAVPAELGRLDSLTELRLEGNALTGDAPPAPGASRFGATLERRVRLWRIGLDRFLESPVVGNGIHTLLHMEGAPAAYTGAPADVHNLYLLLAGEAGLVPLALYLGFLRSLLRLHWTAPRSPAADTVVGWTIVLVLTGAANHVLLTLGVSMFLAGLACALAAEVRERSGAFGCVSIAEPRGPKHGGVRAGVRNPFRDAGTLRTAASTNGRRRSTVRIPARSSGGPAATRTAGDAAGSAR